MHALPILQSRYRFLLALLLAYLLSSVFYVFKSGLPQPANVIILMAVLVCGFHVLVQEGRLRIDTMALCGAGFAAYTVIINLLHYAFLPDAQFLLSSIYYIYNIGAFFLLMFLTHRKPAALARVLYWGLVGMVVIQLLAVFAFAPGAVVRSVGTFNNPNQLAYWSLLSLGILVALRYPGRLRYGDFAMIAALITITLASISKAGMVAFFFVLLCLLCSRMVGAAVKMAAIFLAACLLIYTVFDFARVSEFLLSVDGFSAAYERLSEPAGSGDDNFDARGYLRMIEHPEYLLLGAGEGGHGRFYFDAREMHSGLGTIIFCYGLPGALLFGSFMLMLFIRLPALFWGLLASVMFFGLAHQNIRFAYFWIFLGACYWAADNLSRRKAGTMPVDG